MEIAAVDRRDHCCLVDERLDEAWRRLKPRVVGLGRTVTGLFVEGASPGVNFAILGQA